jgi:hypothetical protein
MAIITTSILPFHSAIEKIIKLNPYDDYQRPTFLTYAVIYTHTYIKHCILIISGIQLGLNTNAITNQDGKIGFGTF